MKYVNSLKYMNSFERAESYSDLSIKRIRELCVSLGRINIGTSSIVIPRGASGHAAAVMLESVIKNAGYKVGRISSVGGYDSRAVVSLDGEIPEIEVYNRAVAELKAVVSKNTEESYFSEELSFVLALLICKMHGCEYLILEGTSGEDHSLDSVCSPYDLVVVPTALDGDESTVRIACESIKRGAREVISGNQKKNIYEMISSACVTGGVRLNFTSKLGFEIESLSSIKLGFSYGGRGGYTIKSPSYIQRDSAMLVIEAALAIRRDGVKLPWASISAGLASATGTGCFELLSASPAVIVDSAESIAEAELLCALIGELFGEGKGGISVCIPKQSLNLLGVFKEKNTSVESVLIMGDLPNDQMPRGALLCRDLTDAADKIVDLMRKGENIICFGNVDFALEMKNRILKKING